MKTNLHSSSRINFLASNILQSLNYFRSESENSLNSDATSQLLAMSKLSNNGLSSPTSPPSMTEDKESNKNNLLLAMLWLQRHREMMNFGQPNPVNPQQQQHQPTESKVRKFRDRYICLSFQTDWTAQLSQPIISLQNSNKFAIKEELFKISSPYEKSLANLKNWNLSSSRIISQKREKIRSILSFLKQRYLVVTFCPFVVEILTQL